MISVRGNSKEITLGTNPGTDLTTAKIEHFVIIINGSKPLTVITKSSILDVAAVLDPPLQIQLELLRATMSKRATSKKKNSMNKLWNHSSSNVAGGNCVSSLRFSKTKNF